MQARGARAIWEPEPAAFQVEMVPRFAPPPPPPPRPQTSAAKTSPTPTQTQPAVQTREANPTAAADSALTADPKGTALPTAGTDPKAEPPAAPPSPPSKPDPVVRAADWARRPTGADMAKFYPDRAQRLNIEGSTVISCVVALDGAAQNCRVVRETPADMGFGDAALKLARSFRFKPMTVDGQAKAGGSIQIPLAWRLQ